ncbi:LOW QUALITY PROTEIN: RB1-inducible coiled-coil protein 1 [Rhinatrema bivittatum]|uniref:LOW QUALITY PROTEIN: RB1-inducible coiled-coil protein 1 n=1 Tax=Rhinatrema bivittatum TaxID=194408 RepID=UPI001125FB17|nr:LOW QUALITY PROTEIN: RB1-inducible coiled-coil protein 1 [Rhinatrema bivittatum]
MKLYVFLVNTGTTLTFDTELAVQTVADLKHAIQTKYKIGILHQILVVNGGECMAPDRRVCSYSAGTDTNPIFLFNKEMILCERPPVIPKTTFSAENEMQLKVEESLMMPAVFHTVASRTQLAVEMYEVAKKLCSFCEGLVHDEHLQHQGWAAIMANLEDCTHSYQKLLFKFENAYSSYLQSVDDIKLKLTHLGAAVSVMAKIPLLECLTRNSYRMCVGRLVSYPEHGGTECEEAENEKSTELMVYSDEPKMDKSLLDSFSKSVERSTQDSIDPENIKGNMDFVQNTETSEEHSNRDVPSFNVSLLDWINVQDRPNDVESLVRKCFDSMSRLDPRIIQQFLVEGRQTVAKLDNQNMKAIKGLEDRLYALDQMIASCSRLVNEQKELAQGFLANQKRAENLKDPSVLPDLCLSHANQLMIMLANHRKLLDIKQKCTTAKQELANNLQVRLKWCCFVMLHADQDGEKLQALFRLLTELLERVKIVEALSTVPQMYCLAVVEVVRRKMFIKHYREWANALVKDGKHLYEAEKAKRETFGKLFRKSFLRNRLFRGLDSWPSSFCTRKPRRFDNELPDISLTDLQFLQSFCPPEVQLFLRIPLLCDFEPLHQHVLALHNLVKAAQSLDEMSQTITDLLSEQKASNSQPSPQPVTAPALESTAGATAATSSRTPSSLNLQGPLCPPVSLPAPLEELSPDSIDAHTFDFETIVHPNIEQALKQGSLDLDSLAESPESDFMSAVNEFVIEENPASPNVISDPQSPEMMVESLYSSVINAIDNRRMQVTKDYVKEDYIENVSLNTFMEKCRVAALESQFSLRNIKEDLCHFRTLVEKEQCDFTSTLKCVSLEIRNIIEKINISIETTLKEKYQKELLILKDEYENRLKTLHEDREEKDKKISKLKGDLIDLEEILQNKDNEFALVKNEKEAFVCLHSEQDQKLIDLENTVKDQCNELQNLKQSREKILEELKMLHIENDEKIRVLKEELQSLEQTHLKELEKNLLFRHAQELEKVTTEQMEQLEKIKKENQLQLNQLQESHVLVFHEKEQQVQELRLKVSELSDLRCKLEVELALKEAETDDIKLLLEELKAQQQESLKSQIEEETESLRQEIRRLNQRIQVNNDEFEVGLAELRTLMATEKDQCISELVNRHEEEVILLRAELNKVTSLHQQTSQVEKQLQEQIVELMSKLEEQLKVLEKQKEGEGIALQEQKENYEAAILKTEAEKKHLLVSQEQDKQVLLQKFCCEKQEAVQVALKEFELQKEAIEKNLLEKIQQLENQVNQSPPIEAVSGDATSLISELQEKLHEEKLSFLEQLEKQERRMNEEMQNLKTSLIAEQQTNFNTVLTRERMKKENIINDLSDKLKIITQQQERDKDLIETLSEDRARLLEEKKKLEEEVSKLRSINILPSTYSTSASEPCGACAPDLPTEVERLALEPTGPEEERVDSAMETSMMTVHENLHMLSEEKQRIMLLERTLQLKEEENKRLNQRLMSQSMSSVSSRHSEKIAIRDFQVGDLVLIILDERHDNYVLFTVSPTLYFLHSESLTALDLKPGDYATGTSRRPWVLGKVMEKEYCQAKKAQNRFKVPLGTKFYRVKQLPWNKKV